MSVLDLQRIKGPLHELDALPDSVIALGQLSPWSQARVAPALAYSQHVGVEIGVPGTLARNGDREPHELFVSVIKGTNDLPADLFAHHEHPQRHHVDVGKVPDLFLQS